MLRAQSSSSPCLNWFPQAIPQRVQEKRWSSLSTTIYISLPMGRKKERRKECKVIWCLCHCNGAPDCSQKDGLCPLIGPWCPDAVRAQATDSLKLCRWMEILLQLCSIFQLASDTENVRALYKRHQTSHRPSYSEQSTTKEVITGKIVVWDIFLSAALKELSCKPDQTVNISTWLIIITQKPKDKRNNIRRRGCTCCSHAEGPPVPDGQVLQGVHRVWIDNQHQESHGSWVKISTHFSQFLLTAPCLCLSTTLHPVPGPDLLHEPLSWCQDQHLHWKASQSHVDTQQESLAEQWTHQTECLSGIHVQHTYACESWTMYSWQEKKLNSFYLQHILGGSCLKAVPISSRETSAKEMLKMRQ